MRRHFVKAVPSLHHEHESYKWWVLANIMISTFMVVLDATVVNTALPKIMASFGISVDIAQWILTAYMLAFAVMLAASGWFATVSATSAPMRRASSSFRCSPWAAAFRGTRSRSSPCASVRGSAAASCSPSAWRSSCGSSRRKGAASPWGSGR